MDFKKATELFADPAFDGEPVQIYVPGDGGDPVPPEDEPQPGGDGVSDGGPDGQGGEQGGEGTTGGASTDEGRRVKYVVGEHAVTVSVVAERVQYYGPDGKLITESLKDYTRQCVNKRFDSLDTFLRRWTDADQKKVIIDELAAQGVMWEALQEEVEAKLNQPLDPFDLICHVAFDQPPLTRKERANKVKKRNYFAKYQGTARQVLEALLEKYADAGPEAIEDIKILQLDPFSQIGSPVELIGAFGGKPAYVKALAELEQQLYDRQQA